MHSSTSSNKTSSVAPASPVHLPFTSPLTDHLKRIQQLYPNVGRQAILKAWQEQNPSLRRLTLLELQDATSEGIIPHTHETVIATAIWGHPMKMLTSVEIIYAISMRYPQLHSDDLQWQASDVDIPHRKSTVRHFLGKCKVFEFERIPEHKMQPGDRSQYWWKLAKNEIPDIRASTHGFAGGGDISQYYLTTSPTPNPLHEIAPSSTPVRLTASEYVVRSMFITGREEDTLPPIMWPHPSAFRPFTRLPSLTAVLGDMLRQGEDFMVDAVSPRKQLDTNASWARLYDRAQTRDDLSNTARI
ncbi:hypothetical protein BU17DRAFT_65710 [Hysterangium stoloniferum]|nr:hypothetical protein BU17DRAFT_65710 [Hysterangium stoloniferum]